VATLASTLRLSHRARQAVLTAHIIMSVGLLGDSAGFLAIAIRAAGTDDPELMMESVRVLGMFSVVFGIPLSVGTLLSGVLLGVGTKWGVFRYPWVTAKLLLVITVMLVGGLVIGPAQGTMLEDGGDATPRLIAAAAYDVCALMLATALSVFKPGGRYRQSMAANHQSSGVAGLEARDDRLETSG
jgi:hypothetical protein